MLTRDGVPEGAASAQVSIQVLGRRRSHPSCCLSRMSCSLACGGPSDDRSISASGFAAGSSSFPLSSLLPLALLAFALALPFALLAFALALALLFALLAFVDGAIVHWRWTIQGFADHDDAAYLLSNQRIR